MEIITAALPGIISAATLAVVGFLARKLVGFVSDTESKWDVLLESQKNQLKATIVERHETAVLRGYVTPNELESTIRMFESYRALSGNSYVSTIVDDMKQLPIHNDWKGV